MLGSVIEFKCSGHENANDCLEVTVVSFWKTSTAFTTAAREGRSAAGRRKAANLSPCSV